MKRTEDRKRAVHKALNDLSLAEFQNFDPAFQEDVYSSLSLENCVMLRSLPGGPAPDAVRLSIEQAKKMLLPESL